MFLPQKQAQQELTATSYANKTKPLETYKMYDVKRNELALIKKKASS